MWLFFFFMKNYMNSSSFSQIHKISWWCWELDDINTLNIFKILFFKIIFCFAIIKNIFMSLKSSKFSSNWKFLDSNIKKLFLRTTSVDFKIISTLLVNWELGNVHEKHFSIIDLSIDFSIIYIFCILELLLCDVLHFI